MKTKGLNKKEKRLAEKLRNIAAEIPGDRELEMELVDGAWYAYMYDGNEAVPINGMYEAEPVITKKQAEKNGINVFSVFDHIGCYYCG